jgi:hypothetical protein
MPASVFDDEWRDCLREHYKHVIRTGDRVTLPTLTDVLTAVGFRDDELRDLRLEATLRADDLPDDFVPDLDILGQPTTPAPAEAEVFQPHPLECQCPACQEIALRPHDADGQPIAADRLDEDERAKGRKKGEKPQQLSLF